MDIKKLLGNKIRELRLSHSFTQETLAEKIKLSPKSLSQIELGNNFVSAETLECLCQALNTTPKKLFDFCEDEMSEKNTISAIVSRLSDNPKLLKIISKIIVALDE